MQVESPEPLINAHVLHLSLDVQHLLGIPYGILDAVPVLKQMALYLGHVQGESRQGIRESIQLVNGSIRVEFPQHAMHLLDTRMV